MKISVILCTYNRCQALLMALNSIAVQTLPQSVEWEVLVVDNNSRDRTHEVVEQFCCRYPGRFRYLFEPRQGKSHALNAAIREARGDILAFMDDDVTVAPRWLDSLTSPLSNRGWAGSGGRTLPTQTFIPPDWLGLEGVYSMMGILYAHFDLGDNPRELDRPPYGANMAYRKEMFTKYGFFRTDMGPSPSKKNPRPNEDTEFGRRLMAAGEHLWYEPSAVVRHPVPQDRLKKEYFLAWWFDWGRAAMRERGKSPDIWGIPRHYLSVLRYGIHLIPVRTLRWVFTFDPGWRFQRKCQVWKAAGEIVEIYRLHSLPKESALAEKVHM